ncbi:MAG: mechanosensitive ion channel family protein [Actinomycetota bacterium]
MVGEIATPLSREWFTQYGWELAVTLVIAVVFTVVSRRWVRRYRRRAKAGGDDAEGRRRRRVATVVGLFSGIVVVVVWFVFVLTLLKDLGVDITPIIASAGIAGIALGFGAQALVRDTISGLFIFLEGQFDVGDIVDLTSSAGTVSGTVETLNLRTTAVRQYDGSLSTVPNGLIEVTNNRTRGWGRAVVDVRVALDEESDRVRDVLEELFAEIQEQPPLGEWLRQPPQVLGVTQLTDTAQVIRVAAETMPSHRIDTERLLRAKIVARLSDRGVKTPPVPQSLPPAP